MSQESESRAPTPSPPPAHPSWREVLVRLRWPLVVVLLALMVLAVVVWSLRGAGRLAGGMAQGVGQVGERLIDIAERFRTGHITETFIAALPELTTTGSGNLELATATVTETFARTDDRRILWDWVSLGETEVEIRVPVTYRYHLRMDDPWRLEITEQTCVVYAPPIRPSLPPAIHTDRMQKRTQSGWLRFDADEQMVLLEQSITPTLERYALDPRHLNNVREECRRTVAGFVRNWLLREDHWREDRFHAIVVLFADEAEVDPETQLPTLTLEP